MIFNMVGVGGGSGATLVVSSPVNVSVTVSKDDKSYTKNSGSLGSTTFKGLATGTWTVTISGNGQTATRTIEITADYAITIAFFSASINITYPANSNCVVTNSGGQTVASDTNTTSSTKTWTATVSATGTYTVTATATDGSGKSKSQSVSITAEGQSESVTLSYRYYLYDSGEEYASITGGWTVSNHANGTAQIGADTLILSFTGSNSRECAISTKNKINFDGTFTKLFADIDITANGDRCVFCVSNSNVYSSIVSGAVALNTISKTTGTFSLEIDISAVTGEYYVSFYGGQVKATISKVWME